jgi:hypothetical protein
MFQGIVRSIFAFIVLLNSSLGVYGSVDTLEVTTHNRVVVVTDPSLGVRDHLGYGVFPGAEVPVRRIMMYVTFGCPDTMRCADWDYKDRIQLQRVGGIGAEPSVFELARLITPYGGFFQRDWTFTWEVDVTDFSLLLRDSVEVNFIHSGYEPNHDRGWLLTIRFELITGPPVAEPVSLTTLWDDNFVYGDPDQPIENTLLPATWKADSESFLSRLRIVQTGHGMDRPDNCAEFCNRWREIYFDDKLLDRRQLWKRCGWNPVYPQAGTWIFDRGNWCPGEIVTPEFHHFRVSGGEEHTLKMLVEPYTATEQNHGAQVISAYLISYQKPGASNDISLLDVVVPSDKQIYSRRNPAVSRPVILVMNSGYDTLHSMRITYGTRGEELHSVVWQGAIPPLTSQEVQLDGSIRPGRGDDHRFVVYVDEPNGQADGYPLDNGLTVRFTPAPTHAGDLIFSLLTNNQPQHNSWSLHSSNGSVLLSRDTGMLQAATQYADTFRLSEGGYQLTLLDDGGDGLEFWWNTIGGRGEARLLNLDGHLIRFFDPDFGSGFNYSFYVGSNPDPLDSNARVISVYPVRSHGETTIRYYANFPTDIVVKLISDPDEELIHEIHRKQIREGSFTFDFSDKPYGRFRVEVYAGGEEVYRRRIRYIEPD